MENRRPRYSLPQQPLSLTQGVEPATLEPTRAGEVLRIDSILRAPQISNAQDEPQETNRAPQLNDGANVNDGDDIDDAVTIIPSSVEETRLESLGTAHAKLAALISHYGNAAANLHEKETWVREQSLLCLVYEGIKSGVFSFDYGPKSTFVVQNHRSGRVYLNVSQEARAAVRDLMTWRLVASLRMMSSMSTVVCAYQLTVKGSKYVAGLPDVVKDEVRTLAFGPPPHAAEKVEVLFDGASFILRTAGGFSRRSTFSDPEDVSYVTSPHIPAGLRAAWGGALASNKERADRAKHFPQGSNLRAVNSEVLSLANVRILAADFLPFDAASHAGLLALLGAQDRPSLPATLAGGGSGRGGSGADDGAPDRIALAAGLTEVSVLDYEDGAFINLHAHVNYPEDEGIVQIAFRRRLVFVPRGAARWLGLELQPNGGAQVTNASLEDSSAILPGFERWAGQIEELGINIAADGVAVYGAKVEAILDRRADRISLDMLSRVLADLFIDSSKILHDLCSPLQAQVLDAVYDGDALNRCPYLLLIASAVTPKPSAARYLLRAAGPDAMAGASQELAQVIGDADGAADLGSEDLVVVGADGLLLAGPRAAALEPAAAEFARLRCRLSFCHILHARLQQLIADIDALSDALALGELPPAASDGEKGGRVGRSAEELRAAVHKASHDAARLDLAVRCLAESVAALAVQEADRSASVTALASPKFPGSGEDIEELEAGLAKFLGVETMRRELIRGVQGLRKHADAARKAAGAAVRMAPVLEARGLEAAVRGVQDNTEALASAPDAARRGADALAIIQVLLLGLLVFNTLDRVGGGSLNLPPPDWLIVLIQQPLLSIPFAWLGANLVCFAAAAAWLRRAQQRAAIAAAGGGVWEAPQVNRRLALGGAALLERDLGRRGGAGLRLALRGPRASARWRESAFSQAAPLRGVEVTIQYVRDESRGGGLLESVSFSCSDAARAASSGEAMLQALLQSLEEAGALASDEG